jgi:biopolymer transport protein ExbD
VRWRVHGSFVSLLLLGACREAHEPTPTPIAQITAEPLPPASVSATGAPVDDGAAKLVVTVLPTSIVVGDRVLDDDDVIAVARRLADDDAEVRLLLRAERAMPWGRMIRAIDLLKQGGVAKYAFLPPDAKPDAKPLPLDLPKAGSADFPPPAFPGAGGSPPLPLFLILDVDAHGSLHVDRRPESDARLAQIVRDALANDPDLRVIVRADRKTTYGRIVVLYGALLEAGARKVAFGVDVGR